VRDFFEGSLYPFVLIAPAGDYVVEERFPAQELQPPGLTVLAPQHFARPAPDNRPFQSPPENDPERRAEPDYSIGVRQNKVAHPAVVAIKDPASSMLAHQG